MYAFGKAMADMRSDSAAWMEGISTMDANMVVTLLAALLAQAIAATGGAVGSMPGLVGTLTSYLIVAAHGGGLTGGCGAGGYILNGSVLVNCQVVVGNAAWLDIPASLQPVAMAAARFLSWFLFPVGS